MTSTGVSALEQSGLIMNEPQGNKLCEPARFLLNFSEQKQMYDVKKYGKQEVTTSDETSGGRNRRVKMVVMCRIAATRKHRCALRAAQVAEGTETGYCEVR